MDISTLKSAATMPKALAAILLAILALTILIRGSLLYSVNGQDFTQDWVAAHALRNGSSIYGEGFTSALRQTLNREALRNDHPPSSVLYFLPLSFLSLPSAAITLSIVSIVSFSFILLKILAPCNFSASSRLLITSACLLSYPFLANTFLFQSSAILATLVSLGALSYRNRKDSSAAIYWGIATALKLFPAPLFLLFLLDRNYKALLVGAVVFILSLSPIFIFGQFSDVSLFFAKIAPENTSACIHFQLNQSLWGVATLFFTDPVPAVIGAFHPKAGQTLLVLILQMTIVVISIRRFLGCIRKGQRLTAVSTLLLATLLISPLTWQHYTLVLTVPIVAMLTSVLAMQYRTLRLAWLFSLALLLLPDVQIAQSLFEYFAPEKVPPLMGLLQKPYFISFLSMWLGLNFNKLTIENVESGK